MKDKDPPVKEAQRVPIKMNPKKPTIKHIIIIMAKVKYEEVILKASREKQLSTKKFPSVY